MVAHGTEIGVGNVGPDGSSATTSCPTPVWYEWTMRPRMILPVLAAAALVACGSETLSAEEFRQRADEICAEGERQIDEVGKEFTPRLESDDPAEQQAALEEFTTEAVGLSRDGLNDLRVLAPPDELTSDVDAWLDAFETSVERLEQLDGEELAELVTSDEEDPFADANRLADDLGLDECGDNDEPADDTGGDDEPADDEPADDAPADDEPADDEPAGDATGTAAEAVFVDIEGWTFSDPPPGADADTLAQSFAAGDVVDSVAAQSMTPTDDSSDGAIILSFALSESTRPFAETFRQSVLSTFEGQGATTEPITLAGQEATFVDASATQGFLGVFWQGPDAAIFALGADRPSVEAAAEALIGANA